MRQFNNLAILAIDTSCDDTCIAIVEADLRGSKRGLTRISLHIKSSIVSSQVKLHAKYGGVYPSLAKREHQRNLVPVLKEALKKIPKSKFPISRQIPNSKFQILKGILQREEYLSKELNKFLAQYEKPKIDASTRTSAEQIRPELTAEGLSRTPSASTLSDNRRVDLIAVTVGPGLEPCLWIGVNFAKALSYFWDLPIIPINHIEAHILANWLTPVGEKSQIPNPKFQTNPKSKIQNPKLFPAVCLVVSGGHTQLILMKDFGQYKILGETRDDAAGECLDKVARILGLGYPGGPVIEAEASKFKVKSLKPSTRAELGAGPVPHRNEVSGAGFKVSLPRPMINQKNFDFSFSGLKTAVLYKVKSERLKAKNKRYIREICREVQQSIIDVLITKTLRAVKEYRAKSIILGGGVVANKELRRQFKKVIKKQLPNILYFTPDISYCTDNAAMVGIAAYFHHLKREDQNWQKILVNANLRI